MTARGGCDVCAEVPRCFWLYGGGYWRRLHGDKLCPGRFFWAVFRIGVRP